MHHAAPPSTRTRRISPKPRSKFATPPNRAQDTVSWARSFSASRCIKIEISASTQAALSFRSVVPAILHVGLPYGGRAGAGRGSLGQNVASPCERRSNFYRTRHDACCLVASSGLGGTAEVRRQPTSPPALRARPFLSPLPPPPWAPALLPCPELTAKRLEPDPNGPGCG